MAEFDFKTVSNEELIKMGDLVANMSDCDEKRAYNSELAKRCREIWEKTGNEPKEWRVDDLSAEDASFISSAYEVAFKEIEKFVYKFARDTNGHWNKFEQEREDIQQSLFETVFRRFPFYNATTAITTFLRLPFTGTNTKFKADFNHMTMHEQEKTVIIRRAIKEIQTETGLEDNEILVADIRKKLPNESENVIRNMLARINDGTVSYSVDLLDKEKESSNEDYDPEKVILKEETRKQTQLLLDRLEDHERIAVKLKYGIYDDETGYFNHELDDATIGCHKAFISALHNNSREKSKVWLMEDKPYDSRKYTHFELQWLSEKYCVRSNYVKKYIQTAFKKMENSPFVRESKQKRTTYGMQLSLIDLEETLQLIDIMEEDLD